jgi:hypothetical protein
VRVGPFTRLARASIEPIVKRRPASASKYTKRAILV